RGPPRTSPHPRRTSRAGPVGPRPGSPARRPARAAAVGRHRRATTPAGRGPPPPTASRRRTRSPGSGASRSWSTTWPGCPPRAPAGGPAGGPVAGPLGAVGLRGALRPYGGRRVDAYELRTSERGVRVLCLAPSAAPGGPDPLPREFNDFLRGLLAELAKTCFE